MQNLPMITGRFEFFCDSYKASAPTDHSFLINALNFFSKGNRRFPTHNRTDHIYDDNHTAMKTNFMKNPSKPHAILTMIVLIMLSSCIEEDLLLNFNEIFAEAYQWSVPTNFNTTGPVLWIDSAAKVVDSTYNVWSHIEYDSSLYLTDLRFGYWEEDLQPPEIKTVKKMVEDTLDFALPQKVVFTIKLDNLKNNTSYMICGQGRSLAFSDTTLFSSLCYSFKTSQ